jgi:hypothetical protein
MIIFFSWRGYGIGVLLLFPITLVMLLIGSVNLIGKDFTKAHFNDLLVVSSAVAGIGCWFLGRWMNKESVIQNVEGEKVRMSTMIGDTHQLWGIAFQHWSWIYWIGAVGLFLAR